MYIDFEYYGNNGGTISDESAFENYLAKAENEIDFLTFDRLRNFSTIPEEVKRCAVDLINYLKSSDDSEFTYKGKKAVTLANAGLSVGFAQTDATKKEAEIQNLVCKGLINVRLECGLSVLYGGV